MISFWICDVPSYSVVTRTSRSTARPGSRRRSRSRRGPGSPRWRPTAPPRSRTAWRSTSPVVLGWPWSFSQPARQVSTAPRPCRRSCRRSSPARAGSWRSACRTARALWRTSTDASTQPWQMPTQPEATRVAPGVQRAHRDLEALADRAEHVLVGAERPRRARSPRCRSRAGPSCPGSPAPRSRPGRCRRGSGEALVAERRVGLGEDQRDLRVAAHRDEHLRAGDLPAAVGLLRARPLVGGVGAGVGLGQAEAAEPLAASTASAGTCCFCSSVPHLRIAEQHERGLHRDRRCASRCQPRPTCSTTRP